MDKLIPDPPPETTTPLAEAIRAEDLAQNREAIKRAGLAPSDIDKGGRATPP